MLVKKRFLPVPKQDLNTLGAGELLLMTTSVPHHDRASLHERAPSPVDAHPEDADPLGRGSRDTRAPDEHRTIRALAFGLVGSVIAIPILAVLGAAPVVNVIIGLLPLLLTLVFGIALVAQHYKAITLVYLLLATHIIGIALLWLANLALSVPVNLSSSLSLSFLLGAIIIAIAFALAGHHTSHTHGHTREAAPPAPEFHEEKLGEYVHAIEDKVKGLNFAIGRVYRRSNGASDLMRERLRILREWYNEFYEIKPEDLDAQKKKAKVLIHKIHDRLKLLASKENEVFSEAEVKGLKNLARNRQGEDAIIDVLKTNDRDPVEHYYVSALDVCDAILKGLA